tara:strand:- start:254 stop:1138 length:885 start_codon:yes stop_codon:yes gene_type:complete
MALVPSELVLNADGSIYHLNLLPEDIAHCILTVGDPERVAQVSKYFDTISVKKGKREFHAHTGTLNGKRLTVISTGIGTDNVDIVLNELDALANIDFHTRSIKQKFTALDIIRIGTSGSLRRDIPVDSFLLSKYAMGFDGLMHFYKHGKLPYKGFIDAFIESTGWSPEKARPYMVKCDESLAVSLTSNRIRLGVTVTNTGFYGPQGRTLRIEPSDSDLLSKLAGFSHDGLQITNMEMETSGIYCLANLMGHRAVSMNCILANRPTGIFSKNPEKAVDALIQYVLEGITGQKSKG